MMIWILILIIFLKAGLQLGRKAENSHYLRGISKSIPLRIAWIERRIVQVFQAREPKRVYMVVIGEEERKSIQGTDEINTKLIAKLLISIINFKMEQRRYIKKSSLHLKESLFFGRTERPVAQPMIRSSITYAENTKIKRDRPQNSGKVLAESFSRAGNKEDLDLSQHMLNLASKKQQNPFIKAKLNCIIAKEAVLALKPRKYSSNEAPQSTSTYQENEEEVELEGEMTTLKLLNQRTKRRHQRVISDIIDRLHQQ